MVRQAGHDLPAFDGVVLAGGQGRRLGGVDKPGLQVGGQSLLARVLDALAGAERLVVVGPPRADLPDSVTQVCEHPPGAGPLAALAAALPHLRGDVLALVAADLPFLDRATVVTLRSALEERAGAVLVDHDGAPQWLAGVWHRAALLEAVTAAGDPTGQPLRRVLAPLAPALVVPPTDAGPPPWWDCDEPADLDRARQHAAAG